MQLKDTIDEFMTFNDLERHRENTRTAFNIQERLKEYIIISQKLNQRQHLFQIELNDFTLLNKLLSSFQPYFDFWNQCSVWKEAKEKYINSFLNEVNAEESKKI